MRSDFGGGDVNNYLGQLLKMKGVEFLSDSEKYFCMKLKKNMYYAKWKKLKLMMLKFQPINYQIQEQLILIEKNSL